MTGYHAFISYSRSDIAFMTATSDRLRESDLSIWTDKGIETGTSSWKRAIENALLQSQCMVCLLSPDANQSKWVRAEIDFAEMHGLPIILMLIRGTERESIPFGYATTQWIDARNPTQFDACMRTLVQAIRDRADDPDDEDTVDAASEPEEPDLTNFDTLIRLGNLSHYRDDHEDAIKYYSLAIEIDDTNPIIFLNRGTSYTDTKQFNEAIHDFRKAITIDSNNSIAYLRLARAYRLQNRLTESIEAYTQSIHIKPTAKAHFERGGQYFDKRQFAEARRDYVATVALKSAPDLMDAAYNNIGECSFVLGDYQTALENFQKAIEHTHNEYDYPIAKAGKAITLFKLDDEDAAILLWLALVETDKRLDDANFAAKHFNWPREMGETARELLSTKDED